MSEPTVSRAGYEDLAQVLELMDSIQPHLTRSVELLDWQYLRSPGGHSNLYLLKDDDGTLISTYGAVSQRLRYADTVVPAYHIQDVMTAPEHRGKGYLHLLAGVCFEDMRTSGAAGYTFPNELSHRSFGRTGWHQIGLIPSREGRCEGATSELDLLEYRVADLASAGAVWEAGRTEFGVERDGEFLRWRYGKPGQRYECFSDGEGFLAVMKFFDAEEFRVAHLLDFVVAPDSRLSSSELLHAARAHAAAGGAQRWTAWLPGGHRHATAFDAVGLELATRPERFCYVTPTPDRAGWVPEGFTDFSLWQLTQGDSDVY